MARHGENIHKRRDGRWEGRYKNGFRADGSVKYSSVYARSYSECKHKLIEALASPDSKDKSLSKLLFSELLTEWLAFNRLRLKGGTRAKYINIINTHLLPSLGGVKLSAITPGMINSFLENQLQSGRIGNNRPLSPSYVRTMAIIIESALQYAVAEGRCPPFSTSICKPTVPKQELVILSRQTEETLTQILMKESSLVALGMLAALQAGLRIGEVCALRWCDVDFEHNVIHIRHTVSRVPTPDDMRKTMLILDTPKTKSSLRDIPMPSSLKEKLWAAHCRHGSEYVVSSNSSFVGTRTFDYQYRQLLKKYNLSIFSFHTLRHTYATRCAEHGMDAKTLSRLLGHSSSNTSLNIYVHPSWDTAMQHLEQIYCSA